jgi:hypothetical protein
VKESGHVVLGAGGVKTGTSLFGMLGVCVKKRAKEPERQKPLRCQMEGVKQIGGKASLVAKSAGIGRCWRRCKTRGDLGWTIIFGRVEERRMVCAGAEHPGRGEGTDQTKMTLERGGGQLVRARVATTDNAARTWKGMQQAEASKGKLDETISRDGAPALGGSRAAQPR